MAQFLTVQDVQTQFSEHTLIFPGSTLTDPAYLLIDLVSNQDEGATIDRLVSAPIVAITRQAGNMAIFQVQIEDQIVTASDDFQITIPGSASKYPDTILYDEGGQVYIGDSRLVTLAQEVTAGSAQWPEEPEDSDHRCMCCGGIIGIPPLWAQFYQRFTPIAQG